MIEVILNVHEATCRNIVQLYNEKNFEEMGEHVEELEDQILVIRELVRELIRAEPQNLL